jgi:hypothetical protein
MRRGVMDETELTCFARDIVDKLDSVAEALGGGE